MKKKPNNLDSIFVYFVLALVVALCIVVFAIYLDGVFEQYGFLIALLLKVLIFVFTYCAQLIIHEIGHLVAGFLSGYEFGSFRAGNIMIVKNKDKLELKLQSIAGTGGQCLMLPPTPVDGKLPVVFYNLGGVLMNALTLPICILIFQFCTCSPLMYATLVLTFTSGAIVILTNGIPLKLGMMNNDGSNALELYKNEEAMLSFYHQFMIIDGARNGVRLKDLPEEYFPMPSKDGIHNSISVTSAVLLENRLIDSHNFDEAMPLINKLLYTESALVGLYKKFLLADKIFIELLHGREEEAKRLYSDNGYQSFSKQMKNSINIIRTEYAFVLLCEKNQEKAREVLARFNKCAKTHPYATDVVSERELISLVDEVYRKFG